MAENTFPDSEEERQANIQAVLKECTNFVGYTGH